MYDACGHVLLQGQASDETSTATLILQTNRSQLFTELHFRLRLLEAVKGTPGDCAPDRKLRVVEAGAADDAFGFEALLFVIAGRGCDILTDFLSASAVADTAFLFATRCATMVFISDEDCKISALTF